jgi:hypothetical protein
MATVLVIYCSITYHNRMSPVADHFFWAGVHLLAYCKRPPPALTGETWFHCECGCIPGTLTADPLDGKLTIDPLDQWDCVFEWYCRASTRSPPSSRSLTGDLTGHCVARKRRSCKEWNGTKESNSWSQLAFHIVGTKPIEASHCCAEPRATDQSHWGH